ncbi:hypothetical protein JKA74_10765 [Marivirga sp. S37H4]|uniref:Lipoprotein n=1 Tax=Marivirga aurantiaca TaxID=2802615 RepID=A0A934WYU5_9BACT|nr:hypothetical protein [Marivirga aurantiaca]MBK6265519.1 hypothetical protein [Marivirga aurantiaca]
MKKLFNNLASVVLVLMCLSCSTYTVTTENLTSQLSGIDSTNLTPVRVRGPLGEEYNYLANPIDAIEVTDKKGNIVELTNMPSIEIRVTETNGKKTIFYFDRILIQENKLIGVQSRFISAIQQSIPLNEITKIEIQDGKKNFVYLSE